MADNREKVTVESTEPQPTTQTQPEPVVVTAKEAGFGAIPDPLNAWRAKQNVW